MKIWLFALLESLIAALALAAYFLADNIVVASTAAALVAVVGISQPLISAYRGRKLRIYQDQQFQKSVDAVDGHLQGLLSELIAPPLPHRPTVAAILRGRFGEQAGNLLARYDHVVEAIQSEGSAAEQLAAEFADRLRPWSVCSYLLGLSAMASGRVEAAHEYFSSAVEEQPTWIAPWLSWATAAYRQGRWDKICENHPHLDGVDLLPFDAGDESTFLELAEDEREELADRFGQAATSLGNYLAIAQLCRSKEQIAMSRMEFRKAA